MKTLEEKNRMIAEFMGVEHHYHVDGSSYFETPHNGGVIEADELKYHTSWDWLIPVVEKIDNLETDDEFAESMGDITHALIDINIDELYYQVCLFIEKYNKQPK